MAVETKRHRECVHVSVPVLLFYTHFILRHTGRQVRLSPSKNNHPRRRVAFFVIRAHDLTLDWSHIKQDPTGKDRSYYGWLTSLYFASSTMSSVGYGDVTIDKSSRWHILIGILYILAALLVAILALSAAASASLTPVSRQFSKLVDLLTCRIRYKKGGLLHQRIARLSCLIIAEVILQFLVLNLLGVVVLRIFLAHSNLKGQSWMLSFYWSVQTTTTIGKDRDRERMPKVAFYGIW